MINVFFAAIVALFFWGKTSKDIEEKTQLASWTRTVIYGVLTFSVLVFYVKTYQVATLTQTINIKRHTGCYDKSGLNKDTVMTITLYNSLSTGITENTFKNQLNKEERKLLEKNEAGCLLVQIRARRGNNDTIKSNHNAIKVKDGYLPLNAYTHVYELDYMTNTIPSLIPFFITKHQISEGISDVTKTFFQRIDSDYDSFEGDKKVTILTYNSEGKEKVLSNPKCYAYIGTLIMTDTMSSVGRCDYIYESNNIENTSKLGFFTAADISQYTCALDIKSDCYIKELVFDYDIPIEINPHDTSMYVSSKSFRIKEKFLNEEIANQPGDYYCFHVKFPTFENLQLIRSLILTTLLTALVSLFCLNLFYRIRKHLIDFREKHILEINKERVESFRKKMCILLFIFLFIIVYVILRIMKDEPFHISIETAEFLYSYYEWMIIGFIVLLSIIIYFMFRKAYIVKKKK